MAGRGNGHRWSGLVGQGRTTEGGSGQGFPLA